MLDKVVDRQSCPALVVHQHRVKAGERSRAVESYDPRALILRPLQVSGFLHGRDNYHPLHMTAQHLDRFAFFPLRVFGGGG